MGVELGYGGFVAMKSLCLLFLLFDQVSESFFFGKS